MPWSEPTALRFLDYLPSRHQLRTPCPRLSSTLPLTSGRRSVQTRFTHDNGGIGSLDGALLPWLVVSYCAQQPSGSQTGRGVFQFYMYSILQLPSSPFSPALKGRDESRGYVQRFPRCIARELQTSTRCSVVTLACDVHPALQVGAVGQKAWRLSLEHGVTAGVLRCAQWPASFAATGGCSWLLWLLING